MKETRKQRSNRIADLLETIGASVERTQGGAFRIAFGGEFILAQTLCALTDSDIEALLRVARRNGKA